MDSEHRNVITSNITELVQLINLDTLTPSLQKKHIFTNLMLEDICNKDTDIDRKHLLLNELVTRGPYAFEKFIDILKISGHNEAVSLLQQVPVQTHLPEVTTSCIPNTDVPCSASGSVAGNEGEYQLSVIPATEFKHGSRIYKMSSKPRGYCLIINNEDFKNLMTKRDGTHQDVVRLDMMFQQLDYKVIIRSDLEAAEMKDLLSSFAKKAEHSSVDSCVIVILSHGKLRCVYGVDAEPLSIDDIIEMFDNWNCPQLREKPKMLFVQACRGLGRDNGVPGKDFTDSAPIKYIPSDSNARIPTLSDMLISYSTIEGNVSNRNDVLGSWYCQELVKVIMQKAWNTDLSKMLLEVDENVKRRISHDGEMQATEIVRKGWSKELYFNPGL